MRDREEVRIAEQAVIGDLVHAPSRCREVAAVISPADFGDVRLGQVFGLIVGMVGAHGPGAVTTSSVIDEVVRRRAAPKDARAPKPLWPDLNELGALMTGQFTGNPEGNARVIREASIDRQVESVCRRHLAAVESGQSGSDVAVRLVEDAKAVRDGARSSSLRVRLLADIFDDEDPGYDWLIPGLLERGDRLVYTGAEGAGKSTFGRQLAMCAAGGIHPFKPERFEPIRVNIIDAENSEKQWRRKSRSIALAVQHLTGIDPAQAVHLSTPGRIDITKPDGLAAIHEVLDEHPCDLLLIGPLYKMVPGAITNDDDAAPLLAAYDSIRERTDGPAMMMEAHAGHALGKGGERDFRPRGSSALLGWPEFGFGFAPDPEDENRIQVIRWRGDRDERDWPTAMKRGGVLPWTDDTPGGAEKDPHSQPYSPPANADPYARFQGRDTAA